MIPISITASSCGILLTGGNGSPCLLYWTVLLVVVDDAGDGGMEHAVPPVDLNKPILHWRAAWLTLRHLYYDLILKHRPSHPNRYLYDDDAADDDRDGCDDDGAYDGNLRDPSYQATWPPCCYEKDFCAIDVELLSFRL
uniref:Uncharacterized protein n=1 Tax=Glossina palpalis gambiensis TaxID=67801 RepID=A0A1B0BGX3_9MUSC